MKMAKTFLGVSGSALLVVVGSFSLAACGNMKKQRNLHSFDPSIHFPNGASAQLPPPHTVAQGQSKSLFDDAPRVEQIAEIPRPITAALLQRGRERFEIYCAVCHGIDGYGRGIVVSRGFPAPPSFHDERLRLAPVGHFFNVMTHGYGVMYGYGDRIDENDRWSIAGYIRALQRSQRASIRDVPNEDRPIFASP